ncbi:MAG: mycothiol synthase [Acidimicrobiia bacterium]
MEVITTDTLDDEDRDAIRALCAASFAADRHAPLSDDHRLALDHDGNPGFAAFFARDRRRLVGYAQLVDEAHTRDLALVVHPMRRGNDVAARLTRAALDRVAFDGGATVQLLVPCVDATDDAVLAGLGFSPARDLVQLRCPLPLEETPAWPAGTLLRAFEPGRDDDAWLALNNAAFADHPEQGGWDRDRLAARLDESWFDPAGFLLAVRDGTIAGFCWTKLHRAERLGEIYVIAVDPAQQGHGLGRALAVAGLASIAERGIPTGMLYVDADNAGAVALYRGLGFAEDHRDRWYVTTVEAREPEPGEEPGENGPAPPA